MLLKNIGEKIVNVGSTVLMPGDEMPLEENQNTPAIKVLADMGYLKVEDEASTAKAVKAEKAPADGAFEQSAAQESKPKKVTRRTSKEEAAN